MNILLTHRPGGAYGHISEAWFNTLKAAGHKAARWDGQLLSWHAFQPEVYIGCSGHRQPIPRGQQRGGCRVAIHVNPHGPVNTGVNEPPESLRWVLEQRPQLVFGYGFQQHGELWSGWTKELGLPWCPLPNAGDTTQFFPHNHPAGSDQRDLALCYVGGYWPYKAQVIDPFLEPLRELGLSVYGWGNWPGGALGQPTDEEVPRLLARARVGPCISEPHTHRFGIDLPERVFKVALSGAVAVHDPARDLGMVLGSVPVGHSPTDYADLCRHWVTTSEQERTALAVLQRQEVLSQHTYFHRLARLLHDLGFSPAVAAGLAPYWPT